MLSAATILGETAGAARFRSKDAYARFTGTAPIPVWSGNNVSGRLNRTVNHALHMIAVTQTRGFGPGKAYYESVVARGKTRKEALRLLRRRLSDVETAQECLPVSDAVGLGIVHSRQTHPHRVRFPTAGQMLDL